MNEVPTGAGKSSFDLVDIEILFRALNLQPGSTFLDLASGSGQYALEAAGYVTERGAIYAIDLWREGIAALKSEAQAKGIEQIHARVADVSKHMPLADQTVDVCLAATVLHDLVRDRTHEGALGEVVRVLKPGGKLAVVEFKKIAGPPGPPAKIRLSPEEVEAVLRPHNFSLMRTLEAGPHHYLSIFLLGRSAHA